MTTGEEQNIQNWTMWINMSVVDDVILLGELVRRLLIVRDGSHKNKILFLAHTHDFLKLILFFFYQIYWFIQNIIISTY